MNNENKHDPVNALSEADATGRTAEIFAEIRAVMEIPIITSIWRTLAAVDGGLEAAWTATRPIYESGQPQAALVDLNAHVHFPVPEQQSIEQLKETGFYGTDRSKILSLLKAYNRSNALNLIALNALLSEPGGECESRAQPAYLPPWPTPPYLPSEEEIDASDWEILERIKHIGATDENPAIPTLWRHMIHWPELLELIYETYSPLQKDGTIHRAIEQVRRFAESEAPPIARFKPPTHTIPTEALEMIRSYVGKPPSVSRMVTVGNGVAQWLNGHLTM